jgi:hypothetical protein
VFVEDPMFTPVLKSEVSVSSPDPAEVNVRFPFEDVVKVESPVLPTVIVPPDAPMLSEVAAPAKLTVVAVVLNKVKEDWFVLIVASLNCVTFDPESITMLPVVEPPKVNVFIRRDCIEPPASRTIPLPVPPDAVVADNVATGVVDPLTPLIANLADVVA